MWHIILSSFAPKITYFFHLTEVLECCFFGLWNLMMSQVFSSGILRLSFYSKSRPKIITCYLILHLKITDLGELNMIDCLLNMLDWMARKWHLALCFCYWVLQCPPYDVILCLTECQKFESCLLIYNMCETKSFEFAITEAAVLDQFFEFYFINWTLSKVMFSTSL